MCNDAYKGLNIQQSIRFIYTYSRYILRKIEINEKKNTYTVVATASTVAAAAETALATNNNERIHHSTHTFHTHSISFVLDVFFFKKTNLFQRGCRQRRSRCWCHRKLTACLYVWMQSFRWIFRRNIRISIAYQAASAEHKQKPYLHILRRKKPCWNE